MADLVMIKLKKHYGANVAGETAGFTPKTAEWIFKHGGGDEIARFNDETHVFIAKTGKVEAKKAEKTEKAAA